MRQIMKKFAIDLGSKSGAIRSNFQDRVFLNDKRVVQIKIINEGSIDCYCYIAYEDGSFSPCASPTMTLEVK